MYGCLPSIVWLSVLIGRKIYTINLHPSPIEFPLRRWTDMKYQSKIATYRLNRPRGRCSENMSHFVATLFLHPRKHLTKSIHPPPIKVPPRRWIDIKYQTNIATYRLNRPRGRFSESMSNFVATYLLHPILTVTLLLFYVNEEKYNSINENFSQKHFFQFSL